MTTSTANQQQRHKNNNHDNNSDSQNRTISLPEAQTVKALQTNIIAIQLQFPITPMFLASSLNARLLYLISQLLYLISQARKCSLLFQLQHARP